MVLRPLSRSDRQIAEQAWQYFKLNQNPQTGLINAVDRYPWTTLWDQGSALLGLHAAHQLGILPAEQFDPWMTKILTTLENLTLPATQLPNKAYSTQTAEMRQLDNTPDPKGESGWSALDTARFLTALHILKVHYPQHRDRIQRVVARWDLSKLAKDGWLMGAVPVDGKLQMVQEGRLGYEQYAAYGLQLWQLAVGNAQHNPPTRVVTIEGTALHVDQRDLKNSGASNYLTNDPYVLWGLELGFPEAVKSQADALFAVQAKRFERTGILTAVNEDSINRPPYFLYYSVYCNGQTWSAITSWGKAHPELRFVSTKAAFGWSALKPGDRYAGQLLTAVQNLVNPNRGYYSGRYENSQLGNNTAIDVNTNAIVLESLLYDAQNSTPLTL